MTLTTAIALYGAILSSVLLGWNIYRDITNRGKLEVHCYIGNLITPGHPLDDTDYLVYSITNVGRSPILLTHIGGKFTDTHFLVNVKELPKWLRPGDYHLEYTPDLSVLDNRLVSLNVTDSLGKTYKVKKGTLKKLLNEAKEIKGTS